MLEQYFRIYNHETDENFTIVSVEKLIEWLNDVDDVFSFKLEEIENEH
jgi:hypothetical protein